MKSAGKAKHFGTTPVWRGQNRIQISDPSRTLVDVLDDPTIGGGARHVAEVTANYFRGEHRDDRKLLEYIHKAGNRAVFKRLGHIVEALEILAPEVIKECQSELSSGISLLDPSMAPTGRITKRWNLRLNAAVRQTDES